MGSGGEQSGEQGRCDTRQFGNQRPVLVGLVLAQGDFGHPGQRFGDATPGWNGHYGRTRLSEFVRTEKKSARVRLRQAARKCLAGSSTRQLAVDRFNPVLCGVSADHLLQWWPQTLFDTLDLLGNG